MFLIIVAVLVNEASSVVRMQVMEMKHFLQFFCGVNWGKLIHQFLSAGETQMAKLCFIAVFAVGGDTMTTTTTTTARRLLLLLCPTTRGTVRQSECLKGCWGAAMGRLIFTLNCGVVVFLSVLD